jgi:hypothetical protein
MGCDDSANRINGTLFSCKSLKGDYACHNEGLYPLYSQARSLVTQFQVGLILWEHPIFAHNTFNYALKP